MRKLSIFILCAAMVLCAFGCVRDNNADNETVIGGTESAESAENESSNPVSDGDITSETVSADLDDFSSIEFDENITLGIVTENIASDTDIIILSIENGYSSSLNVGNGYDNMILYKSVNGVFERLDVLDDCICGEFTYQVGAESSNDDVQLLLSEWYGELESGSYMVIVKCGTRGSSDVIYASAAFTVGSVLD